MIVVRLFLIYFSGLKSFPGCAGKLHQLVRVPIPQAASAVIIKNVKPCKTFCKPVQNLYNSYFDLYKSNVSLCEMCITNEIAIQCQFKTCLTTIQNSPSRSKYEALRQLMNNFINRSTNALTLKGP